MYNKCISTLVRPIVFFPFLLIAITFLLYAPTFNAEFHFDDNAYILESAEILHPSGCLTSLFNHFFRPDRMLVTLSFAINHTIHGFTLPGYHFVNILLHGLNGVLIFFLLQYLKTPIPQNKIPDNITLRSALSFGAALLFVVHPVAVHSVTYITQRHGLMATFFCLSGFLSYMMARKTTNHALTLFWALFCVICFWGAIHSKPMALVFPLFLIAYEIILLPRQHGTLKKLLPGILLILILFSILLLVYASQSGLFFEKAHFAGFHSQQLWTPWQHFLTESQVFLHYWKILLLPLSIWLSVDHFFPVTHAITSAVIMSWATHLLIISLAFWAYFRKMPQITFGILWFYIALVPPYLLLPIKDVMVDYKTYLPAVGVVFIIADFGEYIATRYKPFTVLLLFTILSVLYCFGTWQRNTVFLTEQTFWTDVIEKYPAQARPFNNRGLTYHKKGKYSLAIADFKRAIKLHPEYGLVHANIGNSYKENGDILKAEQHYLQYTQLNPENADGRVRLGNIYALQKNWPTAVKLYRQAVQLDADNIEALYNLGLSYGHLGKSAKAMSAFNKTISLQTDNYKALNGIGAIYYQNGNKDKAREYFEKSLTVNPTSPDTLYNLAACYANEGKLTKAQQFAKQLQRIDATRGKKLIHLLEEVKK